VAFQTTGLQQGADLSIEESGSFLIRNRRFRIRLAIGPVRARRKKAHCDGAPQAGSQSISSLASRHSILAVWERLVRQETSSEKTAVAPSTIIGDRTNEHQPPGHVLTAPHVPPSSPLVDVVTDWM
jgi:hypothetical protein